MRETLSQGVYAGGNKTILLQSRSCQSPFAVAHRKRNQYKQACRADGNGANGKQSVRNQLGEDVLRKLREAEEEAASLREQLAEAKAKAEVFVP